ncbi:site-specific integrase [Shinella sp. DD12]|uniref:tyrosine-type recombinase/integrase n=1 Tax=Shinella sp. DD12 TaxID=1410620 RepID=UPI001FD9A026|nr:site-specific integrase [Shinella sp. DD12]
MLDERQERIREASPDEEDAILSELSRGYDIAVRFAFLSGCRRMEILGLEWSMVDFFTRNFRVIGKGNKERVIPMSEEIYTLLWAEKDHHQTSVFTFVAARTRKKEGLERGKRYPLTESGLKTAMRRAVPKAGVADFRFHDTRHTAATRVLRKSNLRVAQLLLGHSDVKTTTKYAHALNDDIRAALDAASRPTKNPTGGNLSEDKHLAEKGNPK